MLELLRSGNASPEGALQNLDTRLLAVPPTARGEFAYIVGQGIGRVGQSRGGRIVLSVSERRESGREHLHGTLAGWELSRRQITVRDEQEAFQDGEIWPAGKAEEE